MRNISILGRATTVVLLMVSTVACNTVPKHQSIPASKADLASLEVAVISIVPEAELSARREYAIEGHGIRGGGFIAALCPLCAVPLMVATSAQRSQQLSDHADSDAALFPKLIAEVGDDFTRGLWEAQLRAVTEKPSGLSVAQFSALGDSEVRELKAPAAEGSPNARGLLIVELEHYLSNELDKLRMQVRARLFDRNGKFLADQYLYYLPIRVPGFEKSGAIESWRANGGERYRREVEVGVSGLVRALELALFESAALDKTYPDANALLSRRNCYSADYEVGVPLDAYNSGVLIEVHEQFSIVRLSNDDILVIARCDKT